MRRSRGRQAHQNHQDRCATQNCAPAPARRHRIGGDHVSFLWQGAGWARPSGI